MQLQKKTLAFCFIFDLNYIKLWVSFLLISFFFPPLYPSFFVIYCVSKWVCAGCVPEPEAPQLWGSWWTTARLQMVLMTETLKCWRAPCLRMSLLSPLWPHLTSTVMFLFVHLACLLIQLPGATTTPSPPSLPQPLSLSPTPGLSIFSWNWWFNEDLSHHEWPLCYCFSPCDWLSKLALS